MDKLITQINRLSTGEKVAALLVLGVVGYVTYDYLKPTDAFASENSPALPPSPSGTQNLAPIGIDPNAKGSATYIVATKDDPLMVRQAASQSSPIVGQVAKDGSVLTTGQTATGPFLDGTSGTWMAVYKPNSSQPWGWMAKMYLRLAGSQV